MRFYLPALLAWLSFASAQSAQVWTLQTAAYGSAEGAAAAVQALRERRFDAYSERSGAVTRVRVGCFLDRASAEDVAAQVAPYGDVQIVAFNPRAEGASDVSFCVRREAGFALPNAWGVTEKTSEHITFWVDAAGTRYLRFDGRGWRIYQATSQVAAATPSRKGSAQAAPLYANARLIGSGELLWRTQASQRTFVVQGEEAVFTLTLLPPSEVE